MKRFFLIFLLLFGSQSFAQTDQDQIAHLLTELESIETSTSGVPCSTERIDRSLGVTTLKNTEGKKFKISVVSEDYVKELFNYLAGQKHIPFKIPEDGCYARAHEMSRLLEEKKIISGKAFIEGELRVETPYSQKGYVEWWYHVAPIVGVREKSGKVKVYVFDPSIFNKPVPIEEWHNIQTKHKKDAAKLSYETQRFNYAPSDKAVVLDKGRQEDMDHAKSIIEAYSILQKVREGERNEK